MRTVHGTRHRSPRTAHTPAVHRATGIVAALGVAALIGGKSVV